MPEKANAQTEGANISSSSSNTGATKAITVFYDGFCPLCVREMRHLRAIDSRRLITMVDVQLEDALHGYPMIDKVDALKRIHGLRFDGSVITGLDVTHACWDAVNKGWMTAWLRWPIIRWFADAGYWLFARYRHVFARVLTGQAQCESCRLD